MSEVVAISDHLQSKTDLLYQLFYYVLYAKHKLAWGPNKKQIYLNKDLIEKFKESLGFWQFGHEISFYCFDVQSQTSL